MKYHYRIVSSFDPTDIPVDSAIDIERNPGYETYESADVIGKMHLKDDNYNLDQYYVKVYPVPDKETKDN
jgi:hypothetical protein